jgi:hypothetical protein
LKGPHLRNDAYLANWLEAFERVIQDAWLKLNALITAINKRIEDLEGRISDTYTWGQKGTLTIEEGEEGEEAPVSLLALPLRVVRDEELVECTAAAEVSPVADAIVLIVEYLAADAEPVEAATLTLDVGMDFVAVTLEPPLKLKKNDKLRVVIAAVDEEGADVVAQVRCR